jgi:DNA-binding response OmpR family regulator
MPTDVVETREAAAADDGSRVLLVEGDPLLRRRYREALRADGYRVDEADCGEDALERMRRAAAPDAMVLEVRLRGMDGITLLRRALAAHPGMAAVFNTASESYADHFGAWAADGFVVKSGDLRELKAAVAAALARTRRSKKPIDPRRAAP